MPIFDVLQVIMILGFPWLAHVLCKKYKAFDFLGPVLLCYAFGMAIANSQFYPVNVEIAETAFGITVFIAIPLLLFNLDFIGWVKMAKSAVVAFVLAVVSILVMAILGNMFFADTIKDAYMAVSLLVGVYTGGTANMASIQASISAPKELYGILNVADVVISGMYLLFLITIAKRVLGKIFLPYKGNKEGGADGTQSNGLHVKGIVLGLTLAISLTGIGILLSILFTGKIELVVVILTGTTLGIAASFLKQIRQIPQTYETGEYLILSFCVAIGMLTDFSKILDKGGDILLLCAFVLVGAILLHYLLCYIFRIDVDTMLITSTAAVFSPAFVPLVAEAINNRGVVLSGLSTGLLGFAVGNYAGYTLFTFLVPLSVIVEQACLGSGQTSCLVQ